MNKTNTVTYSNRPEINNMLTFLKGKRQVEKCHSGKKSNLNLMFVKIHFSFCKHYNILLEYTMSNYYMMGFTASYTLHERKRRSKVLKIYIRKVDQSSFTYLIL